MNADDEGPGGGPPPREAGAEPEPPPPPAGGPRYAAGAGDWSTPPAAPGPPPASAGAWAAGGWGAPGGQAGAWTPTPPRKRRWGWLAAVLGLLWVLAIAAAVVLGVFAFRVFGPMNATRDVLDDLEEGRYPAAYQASCSAEHSRFTERQYTAVMRSLVRRNGEIDDTGVSSTKLHGGSQATVRYWIRFDRTGRKEYNTLVVKESGDWRPCLLSDNPHT